MEERLIAPCGMNCALCVSYLAGTLDLNKAGFHRRYCPGCRPRGRNCTFMSSTCARIGKGLVSSCIECPDFPCGRLKDLDRRYRTKYRMSMVDNLACIRDEGMAAFLKREEDKWRCPTCGGTICCHNGLCLQCDIDTLKQNKKYRWGE